MTRFKVKKHLYLGNISKVFESNYKGRSIVVKKYFKEKAEEFIREKHVLRSTDHENIIKPVFFGRSKTLGFDCLGASLDLAISSNVLSTSSIESISLQIVNAIGYLHIRSIIHFDLKPSNILYTHGKIKLIDFGSAKFYNESIKFYDFTSSYSSLEYLLGYRYARPCKDMWSFGCILYELISGKQLFEGESSISIILQILRIFGSPRNYDNMELRHTHIINIKNYEPLDFESKFKEIDGKYLELITALLELNPESRIDAPKACKMLESISMR